MCLFTDHLKAKVATTDILVYKVVKKVFGNTYETPFMGYRFFFKDGKMANQSVGLIDKPQILDLLAL